MERSAKIDAGVYVYFSFLRPFAEVAGVADALDWTVPRDSLDLYPFLSLIEGMPEGSGDPDPGEYYPPVRRERSCRRRPHDRRTRSIVGGVLGLRVRGADALFGGFVRFALFPITARVVLGIRAAQRGTVAVATTTFRCLRAPPARARGRVVVRARVRGPMEHWSIGVEAFGVQLDDPYDGLRGRSGRECRWASTSSGKLWRRACSSTRAVRRLRAVRHCSRRRAPWQRGDPVRGRRDSQSRLGRSRLVAATLAGGSLHDGFRSLPRRV